jgi:agmatinase
MALIKKSLQPRYNAGENLSLVKRARLLKDPYDRRIGELEPLIPLAGVPWDWSTAGRPGARFAPSAVRTELYSLTPLSEDLGELRWGFDDMGDVDIVGGDIVETGRRVVEASRHVMEVAMSRGVPAVFIGGDHSITNWTSRPFVERGASLVVLDAHYDIRKLAEGVTSGSWLRELVEATKVKALVVGVSEYANPPYAPSRAKELGVDIISRVELLKDFKSSLERLKSLVAGSKVYLSIDMDHLAQAFAPGVNSPTPLGMTPFESMSVIDVITSSAKVVGIDVVEVVPGVDATGSTPRLAAALLLRAVQGSLASTNVK